jgi:hypothetical protein
LQGGDAVLFEHRAALLLILGSQPQVRAHLAGKRSVQVPVFSAVEEGKELVMVLLGDGIVLVIVALRAADGEPQPHGSDGIGLIQHLFKPGLLAVHSSLAVLQGVAMKPCSHFLVSGSAGKQVTRNLLDGELVERHIAVEGLNHPMPPPPRPGPEEVFFVAVAVGVASQI